MKIAINCCYYGKTSGGIREYIYNLVVNLAKISAEEYLCYVSRDDEQFWIETMPNTVKYKIFPFKRNQKIKRALFEYLFWKKEQKLEQFDVFHSPFFHVPNIRNCKIIMTVHDLRFRRFPDSYTFARRVFIQYAFKNSLKHVNHIITVSEFTKKEILNYYDVNENKITFIHEAIDFSRYNTRLKLAESNIKKYNIEPQQYILSVGHLEPRKNYPMLVEAWDELVKEQELDYKLVIVGKKNYKYKSTLKAIKQSQAVVYLDYVSFSDLLSLYRYSKLLIFPSLYEGFGFPPLEAAVFDIPSLVSSVSSIPEICGEGAMYFDPTKKESIKETILTILKVESIYNRYKTKAKNNLSRFNWGKNAEQTRNLYRAILDD